MYSKRAKDLAAGDVMLLADGSRCRVTSLGAGGGYGNVMVNFAVSNGSGTDCFTSGKYDSITII